MALTKAQMGNRVYLQTALENLRKQQDDALRANETTFRQNQRLLGQYNAMNGIRSSGMDESAYVRLLQGRNAGQTSINSQYAPQMAELQGYLDILNARRSSGGRGRDARNTNDRDAYDLAVRQSYANRLRRQAHQARQAKVQEIYDRYNAQGY